jgi:signal transduction histidine kinase
MENKIFDLFYTTKPEGQGMGLPICRQIMQSPEGTIQAERVPEGGALFRITLPPFTAEAAGSR